MSAYASYRLRLRRTSENPPPGLTTTMPVSRPCRRLSRSRRWRPMQMRLVIEYASGGIRMTLVCRNHVNQFIGTCNVLVTFRACDLLLDPRVDRQRGEDDPGQHYRRYEHTQRQFVSEDIDLPWR